MKIHFVCRGNVYRSRIVEAYAKSLRLNGVCISSSGIEADRHYPPNEFPPAYLAQWARLTAQEHNLDLKLSPNRTQTTSQLLNHRDYIVFVSASVFKDALNKYSFNQSNTKIWALKDVGDWSKQEPSNQWSDRQKRDYTFAQIKKELDKLFIELKII